MIEMTSISWVGGVMGEGGCPSRREVLSWGHYRLSPNHVLTVRKYRLIGLESQENTLRNQYNLL